MRSAPAIAFDYRPSAAIAALVGVVAAAAAVAPWFSALPFAAKIVVSLLALAYGIVAVRRFLCAPFRRIAYRVSGWTLVDTTGAELAAVLASHACYGTWVALDFRLAGRRRFRTLVGSGNVDAETRRRLIVLLARAEVVQAG
jgi:hypothetical protein